MSLAFRVSCTMAVCLCLVGVSLGPAAQAQRQVPRDFTARAFVAQAVSIPALRPVHAASYLQRLAPLYRQDRLETTGAVAQGSTLLVNDWTISPSGTQTSLGDLPVNAALSPDGRHLLVVNSGAGVQSVQVVSTADSHVVQTIPYTVPHDVFVGVAYSPDGTQAFISGGGENVVHTFTAAPDGTLTPTADIAIGTGKQNSYPAGLSVSRDGKTLYVANNLDNSVAMVDVAGQSVTAIVPVDRSPYMTLVNPDNGLVYVSNWGGASVSVVDPDRQTVVATIPVGSHPSAMAVGPGNKLFVADSDSDAVSVIDTSTNVEVDRISVAPIFNAPLSSSPVGLAVSPDGKDLYVANAGDNAIAVYAIQSDGSSEYFQGWIPTAWYPTSVTVSLDGRTLFVTNGKGQGEGPNNSGPYPNPERPTFPGAASVQGYNDRYCSCAFNLFTGSMTVGTLSTVTVPARGELTDDTLAVARNDHFFDTTVLDRSSGNPIPVPGGTSPIKHIIYIKKENRTYDQVFGDEPFANGDPSLTIFGKSITPNLHALAERFGLPDNFYADAQVSADGHNWVWSANANDYSEKIWPQVTPYAPDPGRRRSNDFDGRGPLPLSPGGFIWDAAAAAHITYRDYGNFVDSTGGQQRLIPESQAAACAGPVAHWYAAKSIPPGSVLCLPAMTVNSATTPNLVGHFDPHYPAFDLSYRDADRVAEWKREFDQFVANDDLPQLELVHLGNDHTNGTAPGSYTPQFMLSDNDAAVGEIVDAVSHSKYWASTAIFITEDDAQNGPDHVDSHRTTSLVISPYTSQATPRAEHTHYDTASMLRTIELILGLKPLSQYDATAMPMWEMFGATPDLAPFTALPETVPATLNSAQSYGAGESAQMNFSYPDLTPMDTLNQILWHAMKGRARYPESPALAQADRMETHYVWGAMERTAVRPSNAPHPEVLTRVVLK